MENAKVYFSDFRTVPFGDGLPVKLKKLIKKAGIGQIDMDGKFVAIKMHFGELGNISYLRPNYARAVADVVKELGGEHLECAWENGFTPLTVGCPVLIGDGLKGTDDIAVPVVGGEYVKEAKIGRAIMDADVFISLTHFKGHELTGFGGTIKNIGMGCGSRAGKKDQHSNGKANIDLELCRGCRKCEKECANDGLSFDAAGKKMTVNRMAEYAKAVVDGRPNFHISLVVDVSPNCDCHGENDAPILPDIGMFASLDPLALDQACADACLKAQPLPGSQLSDNLTKASFVDHHDHFINSAPESEWRTCLEHAEKIGLGTRNYELIIIK